MKMKLGEALSERSRLQKKIGELRERVNANTTVREGEELAEDPNALVEEAERVTKALRDLIIKINLANANTTAENKWTITELLAERDRQASLAATYNGAAHAAQERDRHSVFGRGELRTELKVKVPDLRAKAEAALQEMRRVDNLIQAANWQTEI
jgi:hypothetical protein